jgi:hypothetical protein
MKFSDAGGRRRGVTPGVTAADRSLPPEWSAAVAVAARAALRRNGGGGGALNAALGFAPVSLFGCVFVRQWNQCEPVPAVERLNVYNAIDPETGLQADCRKK